ncbi:MAG: 2,3-bisphosphoglycerate-independent phosphoglycerate mutase [Patescibacteria group bacterium]
MNIQKLTLIILDGWGYAPSWGGNAVETAETPTMDSLWRKYPHTILKAAEESVGLPIHEPGNSEVGHLNIGSGQIVRQNLPGITALINDKSFFANPILLEAIEHCVRFKSNLHIMGLLSDGGVHSHIDHLFALLDLIKAKNFPRVYLHIFTDGRDTDPMKALSYISNLNEKINSISLGKIISISGRYYAMDRDNRWDRIKKTYDILTLGLGPAAESPQQAVSSAYRQGMTDEFIPPTIIANKDQPFIPINDNDGLIFFNFRADRTREIIWAFSLEKFHSFNRKKFIKNLYFATFSFHEEYEEKLPIKVVFRLGGVLNPVAKNIAKYSLKQFHLAETEKFAHVTYFFNGGKEKPFPRETRELIPSPKVATYDLKPEMSALKVTDEMKKSVGAFDFSIANFANPDMVGHTGNLRATIRACEVVDKCLNVVLKELLSKKQVVIVTADHGNAEQMINPNSGDPHTEHTINPVPFIIASEDSRYQKPLVTFSRQPILSDVSPTILKIMGLEIPQEMTGISLF